MVDLPFGPIDPLLRMPEPRSVPGFNVDVGLDAPGVGLATWKPRRPQPADPTKPGVPTRGKPGPRWFGR